MNSLEWDMVKLAVPFTMRMLITIFIVAVLLNYLWELAQAPLYVGLDRYNAAVLGTALSPAWATESCCW